MSFVKDFLKGANSIFSLAPQVEMPKLGDLSDDVTAIAGDFDTVMGRLDKSAAVQVAKQGVEVAQTGMQAVGVGFFWLKALVAVLALLLVGVCVLIGISIWG